MQQVVFGQRGGSGDTRVAEISDRVRMRVLRSNGSCPRKKKGRLIRGRVMLYLNQIWNNIHGS